MPEHTSGCYAVEANRARLPLESIALFDKRVGEIMVGFVSRGRSD